MSLHDYLIPLPNECKIIAFYSYKGGVGRTMALCNVAAQISRQNSMQETNTEKKTFNKNQPFRILCVDLDLEAPGIPVYLPPNSKTSVKGFYGILHEYFQNKSKWKGDILKDELRRILGNQLKKYAYTVPNTDNLFVLPTGSLSSKETVIIRRKLFELLEPVRDEKSQSKAFNILPFFPEFKAVLQELFNYIFIDSRTGLSDTAYATTTVIADGMVYLFRPNITQLMGIQDVFGRFLIERPEYNLEEYPREIPAIPVLSPRPNYSTPKLQEVRKVAAKRTFRWLDNESYNHTSVSLNPYTYTNPKLLELPFDSSLEIGECLIISPNPNTEIEDPEAPIYKAYIELADTIRKKNAANDIIGLEKLELDQYNAGRKDEAFNCLLTEINTQPDNTKLWVNIWKGYAKHLEGSSIARNQLISFCEEARKLPDDQLIPRFFASLWLSEVYEAKAPGMCIPLIEELWSLACSAMNPIMLDYGISRVLRYYMHDSVDILKGCPNYTQISGIWFLIKLNSDLDAYKLLHILFTIEDFFKKEPVAGKLGIELFKDQLSLTFKPKDQTTILSDIAQAYMLHGDLLSAYKAYKTASALPQCSEDIEIDFVALQMRFLPRRCVEKSIEDILTKFHQSALLMLLEIREFSDVDTVRNKLEDIRNINPALAEDPTFEYYALMHHHQFHDALTFMSNHLSKLKGGVGIFDLARLHLAHWLSVDAHIDEQMKAFANFSIKDPKIILVEIPFKFCLALAICPEELGHEAIQRLSIPQWPIAQFGWRLIACITDQKYDTNRAELEKLLKENQLLACPFRKHEDFPLLRFILERHLELGNIDCDSFKKRISVINLVESINVSIESLPKPYKIPSHINSENDPRFNEIIERWKKNLSWLYDDKSIAKIIDTVIYNI